MYKLSVINQKTLIKSNPNPNPSSLKPLTNPTTNYTLNPLYNLLPNTQNPNKIVDIICTNLKQKKPIILEKDMIFHMGFHHVSRVLLRFQSDSFSALTFFNWVKKDLSFDPSVQDYCIMLHILAWCRNFSQTMSLLAELIEVNRSKSEKVSIFENLVMCAKDCSWDPVVFDMLLKAYLKAGLVRDGFVTFRKMVKGGFVPKIVSVNFLLDGLLKLDRIDECWRVYEEMGKVGVRGNTFTFNILTHVICKSEDVDKVNEFLEEMEEEGFDPDIVTYNTLIDSYVRKGRLKDALYLYNIMYIRRLIPDLITHTSLINGLCKEGNVREAHKLFHRMVQIGLKPDVFCYNTLICGYVKKEMMQEARGLLHDMIKEKVFPNEFTCLVLIEGYRKKNIIISAVNLVVELQRFGVSVSSDLQVDLVVDLCRVDKPFAAKSLWERLMQDGKETRKFEIYNELIVTFCRLDYVNEAIQLKDEMFFKNENPSLTSYKAIIACLCRLNRTIEGEDCSWDPVVFDMLLKAYLKAGLVRDGFVTFRKMVKGGFVPKIVSVNFLLDGLLKLDRIDECWRVYEEMGKVGVRGNTFTFNILTHVICKSEDVDKVNEFLEEMEEEGFDPDIVTYNTLIDSYVRKGRLKDALYLYNIMYIRRLIPDLITHTSLINGLCKEGNVREAHKLFHRMVQIGLKPDVFCYNTLICGYVKKEMMQEARGLLHDMIKEKVFPNEFTCLVLIEGYRKKNIIISSVNLVVELQRFGVSVSSDLQVDLVVDLCRVDKPFAAKSLWERLMQDGKETRKFEIYNELIVTFCRLDYVNEAIQLKDEMFFKNEDPSLTSYKAIIACLCRLNRTIEGEVFMRDMAESGIQPDTTICRSLIFGHCKEKNLDQAESLLRFFAEEFQLCDNECYNEVFRAVCEEGDFGKSMEYQNRMQKVGFTPNSLSFKYAIDGLSRTAACRKAFNVNAGSVFPLPAVECHSESV
ncbi:tetratricopeptide-like helical domain-containing protein [Artemisia annua]|uniref:Tetratricopeptide-like helical domain-containing protein n=1 Tax=Artemisia annua TaxID=35608 RepID=A0A2U1MDR5_ARTAN|nr:tetratricopeptide-like helical domain-containing protein [Artemisia annua]